jgi:hypothetical protein
LITSTFQPDRLQCRLRIKFRCKDGVVYFINQIFIEKSIFFGKYDYKHFFYYYICGSLQTKLNFYFKIFYIMSNITRRNFLRRGAAAAAVFTIAPNTILGKSHGYTAPSDKLNIAAVGIGAMGHGNINNVKESENIVALCDVDWKYAAKTFTENPNAKKYWDFRKMYDEVGKEIDAVIVATADHTHAIIAADAITLDKHVYVQKPLTHSVYESRLLTKLAAKHNIASQMGNQGSSYEDVSRICEYIWNGGIGEITKVECATNRPIWPQGLNTPEKADKVPKTLDWDLFTGPAELRSYTEI